MKNELGTTSWDNSNIYRNFDDPRIESDLKTISNAVSDLAERVLIFEKLLADIDTVKAETLADSIPPARDCYRLFLDTNLLIMTLSTYAHTALSVDSLNYAARAVESKVRQHYANLLKTVKPLQLVLIRAPQSYLDQFLQDERVSERKFSLLHDKKESDFLLGVGEEVLLEGLAQDGYHAWGTLYKEISGAMKVDIDGEVMGLAKASNILFQDDREKRKKAYTAINQAWQQNEIPAASILNSLSGWRLETSRARSHKKEHHYLTHSCHQQKISRESLDTLMQVTYENRAIGHKALKAMAREMGLEKLGPHDLLAAYPDKTPGRKISFEDAMDIICAAFEKFDPRMAEFARHMQQKNWIDATPTENRGSGAYCTGFASVREPRVFITYDGSMKNIITLAHEIGHAYHSWVMRDLKLGQTFYSSPLAETASIFAETLVRENILNIAGTIEEKKAIRWQEIKSAQNMLINIPARFEFERRLMEARRKNSLSVPEIKKINNEAWAYWFEDTLTEYNEMFWASKLHFSLSHISFYNYPYLFGYLFSLGIYAKKDSFGAGFKDLYVNILRDTGSYTAEDLIQRHFGEDIRKPEFWQKSLNIVKAQVEAFAELQS
jgi:oligoendopeptidase F